MDNGPALISFVVKNCLLNNRPVDPVIGAIAIKTAIKIKRFFLSQIEMIRYWGHADPNREDSLAAIYQKILKIAKRVALESEVLTIRMVQATRSGFFKNLKADGILKIFKDLAAMGKAKLVKYKRCIYPVSQVALTYPTIPTVSTIPLSLLHTGFEEQLGLDVSRDCLQFVEKVVSEGLDAIEGHQGNLLDGLS